MDKAGGFRCQGRGLVLGDAVTPFATIDVEVGVEKSEFTVFGLSSQPLQKLNRAGKLPCTPPCLLLSVFCNLQV